MAQTVTLKATPRAGKGSRSAAKLRKQGLVPGIVYGHKQENAAVAVSAEELDRAIRVLHVRMLELELDGKPETVLIREVQWDPFGKQMMLPEGVRVLESPEAVVVQLKLPGIEPVVAAPTAAAAAGAPGAPAVAPAEPEVIKKEKKVEEPEEK